jgi:lipoprotein-anchoring transpeptidase ErfK/SrfK
VGGEVSLGCIRMRNDDVNELFEILPRGAEVIIQR